MPFQPPQIQPLQLSSNQVIRVTTLKEEPNIQHQLWRLPIKYPKFLMIMKFSLQWPKRQPVASSLSSTTKKMCFQIPTPTDTTANKKPPFPIEMWNQYNAAEEGIAQTTNRVEGWKKIRKYRSLHIFKNLRDYNAPSHPVTIE